MSIIQLITVVSNLAIGLLSPPAQPAQAVGANVLSAVPDRPLAAHAVRAVAYDAPDEAITKETCAACHDEQVASFDRSEHNRAMPSTGVECIACHGDATKHIENGGGAETMINPKKDLSAQAANQLCLGCHEKTGEQQHVATSEHSKAGIACVDCHNVHPDEKSALAAHKSGHSSMVPVSEEACLKCHSQVRADFAMPSKHRLHEGAMTCTSCHNVHGTTNARQVREQGKDMCVTCHKDKKGPFMFEHDAASLDGCTACHTPHGSPAQHMLKERDPRSLCLSCHTRDMGKGVPHGRASTTTMGDCQRCHSAVHGSNVDPYLLH
jgi:DmsE family decaheme c-type cytochrome